MSTEEAAGSAIAKAEDTLEVNAEERTSKNESNGAVNAAASDAKTTAEEQEELVRKMSDVKKELSEMERVLAGAKRRLEEYADLEGEAAKQHKVETKSTSAVAVERVKSLAAAVTVTDPNVMTVPHAKVGQIIGSKGAVITELQARSRCKVVLNQDFPAGVDRTLTFLGTPAQVLEARRLISMILSDGPTSIHTNNIGSGPPSTIELPISQMLVGRLIGTGGAIIKDLQSKSGAKIQINQNFPDGVDRRVMITGSEQSIATAKLIISQLLEGPAPPNPNSIYGPGMSAPFPMGGSVQRGMNPMQLPHQPGHLGEGSIMSLGSNTSGQVLEVPKSVVGKIIGKAGETINLVQAKSGAKVQVEQSTVPCKVMFSGAPQSVALALAMVQEVMANGTDRIANGSFAVIALQQMTIQQLQSQQQQLMMPNYGAGNSFAMMQQAFPYGQTPTQAPMMPGMGGQTQTPMMPGMGGMMYPQQQQQQMGQQQQLQPAVPPPSKSPWTEHRTDDGVSYWYNASTRVSQWDRPAM